jgi:hypothetical protein
LHQHIWLMNGISNIKNYSNMSTTKKRTQKTLITEPPVNPTHEKLRSLIPLLTGLGGRGYSAEQIAEFYSLHNQIFPEQRKVDTGCQSCRRSVINDLRLACVSLLGHTF